MMRAPVFTPMRNVAQWGDALRLLQALPDGCSPLGFFDPQYRELLDKQRYGNEGSRQGKRAKLPAMSPQDIDEVTREFARVLGPSGYLMRWCCKYVLCEGHHLRIPSKLLKVVDLICTDYGHISQGYRSRNRGDLLLVLQKPPIRARATWLDHGIPDRWIEPEVHRDRKRSHPHLKPYGLIERLITATTQPGDLVVDPAAGSFVVMHAALALGRQFVGCDLVYQSVLTAGVA
jgi:site-specific DNA-methyltransferase (adenine-specific)